MLIWKWNDTGDGKIHVPTHSYGKLREEPSGLSCKCFISVLHQHHDLTYAICIMQIRKTLSHMIILILWRLKAVERPNMITGLGAGGPYGKRTHEPLEKSKVLEWAWDQFVFKTMIESHPYFSVINVKSNAEEKIQQN